MKESATNPGSGREVYTIETVEKITRLTREKIIFYYESGLVTTLETSGDAGLLFDDEGIHQLRRLAWLLSTYGVNHEGLKMLASLMDELEKLRAEVRFLQRR